MTVARTAALTFATVVVLLTAISPASGQLPRTGIRSEKALARTVHHHRRCLRALVPDDRRLLAARFGVGGRPRRSEVAIAQSDGGTPASVTRDVMRAVRRLIVLGRDGGCEAAQAVSGTTGVQAAATAGASEAAVPASGGFGRPAAAAALGIAILSLIGVAREVRRVLRQR